MTHFLPYRSQRLADPATPPSIPRDGSRSGETPHQGSGWSTERSLFLPKPWQRLQIPLQRNQPALPCSPCEPVTCSPLSITSSGRPGQAVWARPANPPHRGALPVTPRSLTNIFFQREKATQAGDCQCPPSQTCTPLSLSQQHPLPGSTTTPQRQTREVPSVSDWGWEGPWTAWLRHRQGRKHHRQQHCSAEGKAVPSSAGSSGRTGGGAEVALI